MARYWARRRYSPQAFKGMVDEPHSREVEVRKMCEGAGMVLREAGFCAATGETVGPSTAPPNRSVRLSLLAWPVARSLKSTYWKS